MKETWYIQTFLFFVRSYLKAIYLEQTDTDNML